VEIWKKSALKISIDAINISKKIYVSALADIPLLQ